MSEEITTDSSIATPRKKRWWVKLLKITMWTLFAIVLFVAGLMQAMVSVLTPERLTPLTEKYLSKTLNADVSVDRVELTVWQTFPDVTLNVDSLSVVSRALKSVDDSIRAQLPSDADSLLSLSHFRGGINIHELLAGKLSLYDIQLHEPMINIVEVDSLTANYNILPPSEPEEPDTAKFELPHIEIDRFAIINAKPIKYFSLSDSIDVKLHLKNTSLDGINNPKYTLDVQGNINTPLLNIINISEVPFVLNGGIEWNQDTPSIVTLNAFNAGVDIFNSHIDGKFDLGGNDMLINELKISLDPINYSDIKARIPNEYISLVEGIETNASMSVAMQLTKPYNLTTDTIPWAVIDIDVPECKFNYGDFNINKLKAKVKTTLNGENLNDAIVDVNYVTLNGMGVDCSLSTTVSSLISDPLIDGKFAGKMNLTKLPPFIKRMIDGSLSGNINADTQFKLRQSHLDQNNFHKAKIKGTLEVNDLNFSSTDTLTNLYARNILFDLGTSESFVRHNHRVDSLLKASVKIDTCALKYDTHKVRFSNFKAGVGCANLASSTDSTQINPIGGTLKFERLNYHSEADSMRVRLRDVRCLASLRRFKEFEKVPELTLRMSMERASATTNELRASLRDSKFTLKAHLKPRRKMSPQMEMAFNRIVKENPTISNDSAYAMVRREMRDMRKARNARRDSIESEISTIDFGVDRSTRALLNRWDAKGTLSSKSVRVFTPYFPLRNRISDVDIEFTTDSVAINSMKYKAGRSNFNASGSISNINKAISGRSRQPLKMAFMLRSDTIDVNQLAEAVFAGSAYAEKVAAGEVSTSQLANIEDEELLEATIVQEAEIKESGALLVPMNIDAIMRVSSKNVIYGDLLMHNMSGNVQIYRGSLRFDQLRASTDMGSVNLSALYSAPTKKDMSFGFGLELKDVYIDRFINLVPAVDSVMPLLKDIKGIINADLAATVDIDTTMNLIMPSLNAAIKIEGDSLVVMDAETFKVVSKWLLFKDKNKNMIDHMAVELLVKDSQMELFPFMFNIDRYKLGVLGYNDLAMNFNYHVSVLKSPIPFKFGINVKGNPDKMKVKLGRAKFKEDMVAERVAIVDTTRINLLRQIENVFRRGIDRSSKLNLIDTGQKVERFTDDEATDTLSHADSLLFIQEGLLPAPPQPVIDSTEIVDNRNNKKKKKDNSTQ